MKLFYWSSGAGGDFFIGLLNLSRGYPASVTGLNQWMHHDHIFTNSHENAQSYVNTNEYIGSHLFGDGDKDFNWDVCERNIWLTANDFVSEIITKKLWDIKAHQNIDDVHNLIIPPPQNAIVINLVQLAVIQDTRELLKLTDALQIEENPEYLMACLKKWQYFNQQVYDKRHKDSFKNIDRSKHYEYNGNIKQLPEWMDETLRHLK